MRTGVIRPIALLSLTFIQGGAERRLGGRPDPRVGPRLDQHAVVGGGLQLAQDEALLRRGGAQGYTVPPTECAVDRVMTPEGEGVAPEDAVCEI